MPLARQTSYPSKFGSLSAFEAQVRVMRSPPEETVKVSGGEGDRTLPELVKKIGLKNSEVVLSGVTPGGEYKVAKPEEPRYRQPAAGSYESDNYYVQPQWAGGFFGRSFDSPYYNGSQRSYRPPPPRGY